MEARYQEWYRAFFIIGRKRSKTIDKMQERG